MFEFELNEKEMKGIQTDVEQEGIMYYVNKDNQKEHDCRITAVDSNKFCKLIVTSDESGIIRIWNLDKKFLREI